MTVSDLLARVTAHELSEWEEHWKMNADESKRTVSVKPETDAD